MRRGAGSRAEDVAAAQNQGKAIRIGGHRGTPAVLETGVPVGKVDDV